MLVENIKTKMLRKTSLLITLNYMLVASSINTAKKQLDLVTAFFKDTGMTFGDDKCVNQQT